jgi:hypothetical protein
MPPLPGPDMAHVDHERVRQEQQQQQNAGTPAPGGPSASASTPRESSQEHSAQQSNASRKKCATAPPPLFSPLLSFASLQKYLVGLLQGLIFYQVNARHSHLQVFVTHLELIFSSIACVQACSVSVRQ